MSLLFLLLERSLLFFLLVRFVLAFSHGLGGIVSNFISSITPAPPDHRLYVQPAFEEAAFFPIRTSTPGSCRQVNDGKCSNAVICSHEMSQGHVSVLKQGEIGGASVVEGAMECFCSMYFGT